MKTALTLEFSLYSKTFKKLHCIILLLCFGFTVNAQTPPDTLAGRLNGVWYTSNNILEDGNAFFLKDGLLAPAAQVTAAQIKAAYPGTVGVFATVTWRSLAPTLDLQTNKPEYKWQRLDDTLKTYANANLLIMLMVWCGPDSPEWIHDETRVPWAYTSDANHNQYPYYFYTAEAHNPYYNIGDSVYKIEWYKMMDSVAAHVKAYTGKLRKSIVIIHSAESSTGDEGAYHGKLDSASQQYSIPRNSPGWIAFRRNAWKKLDTLYRAGIPIPPNTNYPKQIHVLINCDPDDLEDTGWVRNNVPFVWRKTNSVGHGYHFNGEKDKKALFQPLVDSIYYGIGGADSGLTYSRCRDEMDQYENPWQRINRRQYNFYQAASALHFGLDIWPNTSKGLLDTANYRKGFDFFNKYAGHKNPKTSPGGFCVLHVGIDAADTIKFSKAIYGSGTQDRNDSVAGMARTRKIADIGPYAVAGVGAVNDYAIGGARQDDAGHAQGDAINQMSAYGLNDVGWGVHTGNYEKFVTQITDTADASKNGFGYWRIGTHDSTNWYGRFARGFRRRATGRSWDTLFFKIDDSLFTGTGARVCTLHIAYYDTLKNADTAAISWKILYDSQTSGTAELMKVKNKGTKKWVDLYIPISNGRFKHTGTRKSDIMLVNVDSLNEIFALVEIIKSQ